MNEDRVVTDTSQRLRSLIIFDVALAGGGALFAMVAALTVARLPTLFWLGVFVAAGSALIASALGPLGREDIAGAVLRMSLANWLLAVGTTVVATFAWPLLMQAALLPSALAAAFVSRELLRRYMVISFVAAIAVACLGLLQDVTRLSDDAPEWVRITVLLSTGPPLAALVVLIALQHNLRLQSALDDELQARGLLDGQAEELKRSRLRVVAATDRERRRIERDLHDGAQSRLVAVNLGLARLKTTIATDPDAAPEVLEQIRSEVHLAHAELRDLANGLYPTVLTQHGVVAAITAAADRCAVPVRLDLHEIGRHHIDVEAAMYFCVLEAMQNASRHAQANVVDLRIGRSSSELTFQVADDGAGFDPSGTIGNGLINMADRLGAIGGDLDIASTSGRGTTVTGTVPVSSGPASSDIN